jgi:uncharacterized circularly permuted ATP-grasp superfamily protein
MRQRAGKLLDIRGAWALNSALLHCTIRNLIVLGEYRPGADFCEMSRGEVTQAIRDRLGCLSVAEFRRRATEAEAELSDLGVTFTVYSDKDAIDRVLPFDAIPRVIPSDEWQILEAGVRQRVTAINLLLYDIYHKQSILADRVIPADLVLANANYRPQVQHFSPPCGTYVHICGIDIVRDRAGVFHVLEDNARTPSGISYVISNRHTMMRAFPELMEQIALRPVGDYGHHLVTALREVAPAGDSDPQIALLSPGTYNSAFFEHVFLAREMGVPLVEGRDLVVDDDDRVYMRTTGGLARVSVLYRRLDDDFLDSEAFRPDSMIGVPGLMRAYRTGKVTLANAVGTGVADDKAMYAYMPRIIRYYLDQEPILPNVETHICRDPDGLRFTLDHLEDLVIKPVGGSGGYGIVIGPRASAAELAACRAQLQANPGNFISQPCVDLSVTPTLIGDKVEPRHVDLRPFAVTGKTTWVLPGGLTRVALQHGSLVVNSSQGGGSKDTWVLA